MKIGLCISVLLFIVIIPTASALTFDSPRILLDGSSVQQIQTDIRVIFQATISNNNEIKQEYLYRLTMNDGNGNFVTEIWMTGALKTGETIQQEMSWQPKTPDNYQIIFELVDRFDEITLLASPLFLTLDVEGDPVLTPIEVLQEENRLLKEKITELEKIIDNLNQIIMEQINVIYTWILGQ